MVSPFGGVVATIDPVSHVLTITGDANFNGEGDIIVRVTDTGDVTSAALSAEDTLHVTVNPVNDAPVLAGISDVAFDEDGSDASIDLDAYYSDVETLPANAIFEVVSAPAGATVSIDADHVLTIAGDANFNGEGDITIRVTDTGDGTSAALSAEDTLHVTVNTINDAPLLTGIPDVAFDEDGSDASIDLDAYYSDVETLAGEATFEVVSAFGGVTATIDPVSHVLTLAGDANFNGEGDIIVRVTDTGDGSSVALNAEDTLHVTVNPINDAPAAADDGYDVDEDGTLAIAAPGVLDNDDDADGDALTVTEVDGQAVSVGIQITLASGALLTLNANGSFTYDPNEQFEYLLPGETTTDVFTVYRQ